MINIIPQTEVRLLKTPLEKDSEHTLSFSNINAQTNYFFGRTYKTYNDFTYQKETSTLVIPESYDTICTCNYLMYKNNGFTNKFFYAFITKMEYVNENATRVFFEIDSLQTWYFNITYNKSFIEREHVNDDSRGANTIPEGLELGEMTMAHAPTVEFEDPADFYICFAVSEDPYERYDVFTGMKRQYNGIFGGLFYIFCKTVTDANNLVAIYDSTGKADAISYIFMIPKSFDVLSSHATWQYPLVGTATYSTTVYFIDDSDSADVLGGLTGTLVTTLGDNYTPRNRKLLTYPFSYMVLTNNAGSDIIYKYEDFKYTNDNPSPGFVVYGSITPGCSMKAVPMLYKNSTGANYNFGLTMGKLPICSWNSDVYTNWLTQNGVNNAMQFMLGTATMAGSIMSGSGAGAIGGATMAYNAVHEEIQMEKTPNQARGNTNAGDVNFGYEYNGGLTLYYMSVRNEIARVIDEYFDKYGYKVNRVKVPNITGRRNLNYVKTIDCDFTGEIPQEDMQKIKDIFNRGITFWHNASNFLNYSVNNDII